MRIGWLQDKPKIPGGAERSADAFRAGAPADVEIVDCPAGRLVTDVAIFVVQNCATYSAEYISLLEQKPVIRVWNDVGDNGDPVLSHWLGRHAHAHILVSPKLVEWLLIPLTKSARTHFIPSPVPLPDFLAADQGQPRQGNVYAGRLHPLKGVTSAAEWCMREHQESLDVWGWGDESVLIEGTNFRGLAEYADLPRILAGYQRFVFLPIQYDPCPRVIFEAWAAGCTLITNGRQGATWWLDNDLPALSSAVSDFWKVVLQ